MKFDYLSSPIRVGSLTFKNRMVSAPTQCTMATVGGAPTRELIEFFSLKAQGGAAAVTVGESSVDTDRGITHGGQLFIDSDNKLPWLTRLAEAIKRHGAIASLELCHGGGLTDPGLIGGRRPIGPSALPHIPGGDLILEMDEDMMESVKESFANAALRLKRAGFDMCLVHAGHGWLLSAFFSPYLNRRKDRYGGSLENRVRFPIEVLERIRAKCGRDFAIELRMAGDELFAEGLQLDEARIIAQMVEEHVDMINVSAGMFMVPLTAARMHPTIYHEQGCNVYLAEQIKKSVKIPVSCVGGITTPEMAERIIAEGKADVVAMARALIADPEFPNKVLSGRPEEIRPCHRCLVCHGRVSSFKPVHCSVNPVIGREADLAYIPQKAAERKKVLVIGGGPAGMQAAITAAHRGHDVTIVEKSGELGGGLFYAGALPFKNEIKEYRQYLIRKIDQCRIRVELNTEADPDFVKNQAADAVIVAVGAAPLLPDQPGGKLHWIGDVYTNQVSCGQKILIVGGGDIGCETALHLAREGKEVVLLEMREVLAPDLNFITRVHLLHLLQESGVTVLTDTKYTGIAADGKVQALESGGNSLAIEADTVLFSTGFREKSALAGSFINLASEVYLAGDCLKPGQITEAVRDGFLAAMKIGDPRGALKI